VPQFPQALQPRIGVHLLRLHRELLGLGLVLLRKRRVDKGLIFASLLR